MLSDFHNLFVEMLPNHKKICGYWFRCIQDTVLSPAFGTRVCKVITAGAGTKQKHKTLPQWPGGAVKCLFPGKSRGSATDVGKCSPFRGCCSASAWWERAAKCGGTEIYCWGSERSNLELRTVTELFSSSLQGWDDQWVSAGSPTGAWAHPHSPEHLLSQAC